MNEQTCRHDVYLGLGTNLGDRQGNLHRAVEYINERIGEVISLSSFYETKPVGFVSDNLFLNAACCVKTGLEPFDVLEESQTIEKLMGRINKSVDGVHFDRIIDIDLLIYDNLILQSAELILPHPRLHERDFVLFPLSEIAGDLRHPSLKKSLKELSCELKNSNTKK